MSITTQDINKLRQLTGIGMMDCKKALTQAGGNIDAAIDILRKQGQKVAALRADKQAKEGLVMAGVNKDGTYGVIFSLNSETDFVAKNEQFLSLANQILEKALLEHPTDLQQLEELTIAGYTVKQKIVELISKMGENIRINTYETIKGDIVVPYIHAGAKLGVLVAFQGNKNDTIATVGKDIALQVAAFHPIAMDKEDIPASVLDKELEIARSQSKEGANPTISENIAQGRLNKFIKENTLLNQSFVKDPSISVRQYLDKIAPGLKVAAFKHVVVHAG